MKKIMTLAGMGLLLSLFSLGFTGCVEEAGTQMKTQIITVEPRDWYWNPLYERLEAVFDWDQIDQYMYERGGVIAGVYINERLENGSTMTVLRSLPFVHTYYDNYNNLIYTRTFGFDVSLPSRPPGQVAFYIQDSDLSDGIIIDGNYQFKVTIFWED